MLIDLDELIEDDGTAEGEMLSYELISVFDPEILDVAGTSVVGSELRLALVPDAFGETAVKLRATDPQGLSSEIDIDVRIEDVNDVPIVVRDPVVRADEDSGPVVVSLWDFFDDVEDGVENLRFEFGGVPRGAPVGPPFFDEDSGELIFGLVPPRVWEHRARAAGDRL